MHRSKLFKLLIAFLALTMFAQLVEEATMIAHHLIVRRF